MNKMVSLMVVCLALGACGSDEDSFTWGDASLQLSTDFCEGLATCGYFGDGSTPDSAKQLHECIAHSTFHLCELAGTCDVSLPDGSAEVSDACTEAVRAYVENDAETDACFLLGWYGILPEECGAVFDLDPSNEETSE